MSHNSIQSLPFILSLIIAFAWASIVASNAQAKTSITIVNNNAGTATGFNDATPATPVGGNTGTTLGEQRLIALQYAADLIGKTIHSSVDIAILAKFDTLTGSATSAQLAEAGPIGFLENFSGVPLADTIYPIALANKLANQDFSGSTPEVTATFSSSLDGSLVLGDRTWYYGLDANPPHGDIDFVTVALHELLHGFGFLPIFDPTSGSEYNGLDDIYTTFLQLSGSTLPLSDMSDSQRVTATKTTDNLFWSGNNGLAAVDQLVVGGNIDKGIEIYAPDPIFYGSSTAHFSDRVFPDELMEPAYTEASHSIGLATAVLADMGWGTLSDLSITASATETTALLDEAVDYRLVASNIGSNSATGVTVEILLDSSATVDSISSDQGSCSQTSDKITCTIGEMAAGALTTITVSITHSEVGEITQSVEIYGNIVEKEIVNNTATTTISVSTAPLQQEINLEEDLESYNAGTPINNQSSLTNDQDSGTTESSEEFISNSIQQAAGGSFNGADLWLLLLLTGLLNRGRSIDQEPIFILPSKTLIR